MERTNYYLVSSKSNGKDKIVPDLARAMARTQYYLVSSKSNGKDKYYLV